MSRDSQRHHRPSRSRAVKIHAGIKGASANRVYQEVIALKQASNEPITLFFKSNGGSVRSLKKLESLLDATNFDCRFPQFITVAEGTVRSAAANLLVMGHYAYAKMGSKFVFHGVRYSGIEEFKYINQEDAIFVALRLKTENRRIAVKLARSIIYRIIHRLQQYLDTLNGPKEWPTRNIAPLFNNFIDYLHSNLFSNKSRGLIEDMRESAQTMLKFIDCYEPGITKSKEQTLASKHAKLLKAILINKQNRWSDEMAGNNEAMTAEVMIDFLFLKEIIADSQFSLALDLTSTFHQALLMNAPAGSFQMTGARDTDATNDVRSVLLPLWCFSLAIGHRLMRHESTISAPDAYWLGLIDEVLGTDLICVPIPGEHRRQHLWAAVQTQPMAAT